MVNEVVILALPSSFHLMVASLVKRRCYAMKGKFTGDLHFGSLHAFLFGDSTIEGDGFHVEDDIRESSFFIKPIWAVRRWSSRTVLPVSMVFTGTLMLPLTVVISAMSPLRVACPVAVPKMSSFGALLVNLNLPLNAPASA